jgi:hypothetical protein
LLGHILCSPRGGTEAAGDPSSGPARSHPLVTRTWRGLLSRTVYSRRTSPSRPGPPLSLFTSSFLFCLALSPPPSLANFGGDRYSVPVLQPGHCRHPHTRRHLQVAVALGGGGNVPARDLEAHPSHVINAASSAHFPQPRIAGAAFLATVKPQRTRWVYEWEGEAWYVENENVSTFDPTPASP